MKRNLKAQISIFIIIGLIIIIIIGLALFNMGLISKLWKKSFKNIGDVDLSLKSSVQECLKMTGEEALKLVAIQGRVYPENFFAYQNNKVYYASEGIITIEEMQDEISTYINDNIKLCTQRIFDDFRKSGVEVNENNPTAKTVIAPEDVSVSLNYPIEFVLVITNQKNSVSEFVQRFDVRLGKLHEISSTIVKASENNQGLINMTYLNNLDVQTTVIPYEDGTTIFFLEDTKSRIRQFNYAYSFAVK